MFKLENCALLRLCAILMVLALSASGCAPAPGEGGIRVLVDGQAWKDEAVSPENGAGLRVYITGDAVYMEHADCDNQDCVHMGAVTRENLELRVMGGFIICLPHKISVEVREG